MIIPLIFAGMIYPAVAENNIFQGTSTFENTPSEVSRWFPTTFEIKFQYSSGPWSLDELVPVFEISPENAASKVHLEFNTINLQKNTIGRIPVIISIESDIEYEKVFLSVSFEGKGTNATFKSGWNDSLILNIGPRDEIGFLVEEPNDNPNLEKEPYCGEGTTYTEGICVVDKLKDESSISNEKWGTGLYSESSPLKQIKNGVALIDVKCNKGKFPSYKGDRMRVACVSEETQNELWSRGWATMRLISSGDNISHALCNNYEGKWHPKYEGCREVSDLQCSLMGGKFVDGLEICYNEICPKDKTYTLCVTNPEIWDDSWSVGNWTTEESP